jgi:hypothetical protein
MAYMDLYGRNPDTIETAFDYPQPVMPLKRAPKTYLQLPAAANRIFGNPSLRVADGDDLVVALDPSSVYERTQRWKGIGGVSEQPAGPSVVRRFSNEYLDFAKDNPTAMTIGIVALTLIALGGMKVLGRLGG